MTKNILNISIKIIESKDLIGMKTEMSFAENKTGELWQRFMSRKREVSNKKNSDLYSIEVYDNPSFFRNFDVHKTFEKWAAVEVESIDDLPEKMERFVIPAGRYVVVKYKGKNTEAPETYRYILGEWIPSNGYQLDHRPHFARMGDKYKNNDPESEEELWFPIK